MTDRTNFRIIVAVACALAFYAGYASAGDATTEPTACEVRSDIEVWKREGAK